MAGSVLEQVALPISKMTHWNRQCSRSSGSSRSLPVLRIFARHGNGKLLSHFDAPGWNLDHELLLTQDDGKFVALGQIRRCRYGQERLPGHRGDTARSGLVVGQQRRRQGQVRSKQGAVHSGRFILGVDGGVRRAVHPFWWCDLLCVEARLVSELPSSECAKSLSLSLSYCLPSQFGLTVSKCTAARSMRWQRSYYKNRINGRSRSVRTRFSFPHAPI